MEDTQKYLNSILEKRLGSVVNHNSTANKATTVTRLPRRQQRLQQMPTVFRKKEDTVFHPPPSSIYKSQYQSEIVPEVQQPTQSQRVEYMLISKRIGSLQDQQAKPVVDVSKYKQSKVTIPEIQSLYRESQAFSVLDKGIENGGTRKPRLMDQSQFQGSQRIAQSGSIPNPKRKKIFGQKKEPSDS